MSFNFGQGPNQVLVGVDATVYNLTPAGADTGAANLGSTSVLIGIWKSIEVEVEQTWDDVTPSAQKLKEKRATAFDWRATLEQQIRRGNGSIGLEAILANDYVQVVFTESNTGQTITLYGGIARDRMKRDRGEAVDTLEIENVGDIAGTGSSILYA